ncbi:MAG: ATP-dependent helicase RecG [Verrucomicrobiota bacterium]|jgi:ATP-dependent DNA helicase RecG
MSEALIITERVRNSIKLGESHFREFKSAWEGARPAKLQRSPKAISADIAEALVAFANADGGELLIGVEDSGEITGVPHQKQIIDQLLAAPTTHVHEETMLPMIAATRLTLDEKTVLFFSTSKGTTQVYQLSDGRCVRRKDRATVPETPHKILFDRQETTSREFDRQFVDGATVTDLDLGVVEGLIPDHLKGLSPEKYLQQIGVAEYGEGGIRLRRAALLLFGKLIHHWHPRCEIRILRVAGSELKSGEHYNVTADERIQGHIFDLLLKSWENLRPFLTYKTEFGSDARFEQKFLYPEGACREALVNAIAHRDYIISNGIDVFVFDNRMEIRSPGALLSTLTVGDLEKLEGAHESRNALISRVLRESKFMRELGEGMKRIFQLMEANELEKPKLSSNATSFSVTLPHRSVFTGDQEQWLLMFQQFDLTGLQKRIMLLGMSGREISPVDIYRAINTDNRNIYDNEVTGLRKAHLLVEIRTNPEATRFAKARNLAKSEVPRFKVQLPGIPEPSARPTSSASASVHQPRGPRTRCAFVTNLPYSIEPETLETLFSECGEIDRVDFPIDNFTQLSRGFAFVWFTDGRSVQKAIERLNGYSLKGRPIMVHPGRDKEHY